MIRVWKIWDKDCPICSEMTKFDRGVVHSRGGYFRDLLLSDVPNNPVLMEYMKANVVTDDGTIDIPVYLVEWRNLLVGFIQGSHSRAEFKSKLVQVIAARKTN